MSQVTKVDWIVTLPAFKVAQTKQSALKIVCNKAVNAIQVLLANELRAYHVRRYVSVPWNRSEGSVSHLLAMENDMIELAFEFWMDIYLSKERINHIHIIAPYNAAAFAIKFLAFFEQHATHLGKYSLDEFDEKWNLFPISNLDDGFPVHPCFRSLTIIHPSLPKPSYLARILFPPDIYCLTRKPAPMPEIEIIYVFTGDDLDASCQNIDTISIGDRTFKLST